MAAGAWTVYNEAKKKIGNSTLNLAGTVFRMSLFQSTSNAATLTLSIFNEVTNEVADGNGYSTSGKAMTGEVWTVGRSATEYKFDADDSVWTATGGAINSIKFAVIWVSAAASANRFVLCRSTLTTTQFNLSTGNTLTVQQHANGILLLV